MSATDASSVLADLIAPRPNPYLDDPTGWVSDRLDEDLWSKQREVLQSVRDNRRTAVHSCHSAGKSFIAARAAAWWLECHPPGTATVVSTAPSWDQVRLILWKEIAKAHRKGGLVGRMNQTEWLINDRIQGFGRKPPDIDEYSFQGIHDAYVLVILDEAGGIPEKLWEAVGKITTGTDDRVLAIGNPDFEGSRWFKVCQDTTGWNVIHIDGLATPHFTGEPLGHRMAKAPLLSRLRVDELIADYGLDSPQYLSQIRGVFPPDRMDGVVPWSAVKGCQGEEAATRVGPLRVPVELGIDVGGGVDATVIYERCGMRPGRVWRSKSGDALEIADLASAVIRETRPQAVKIDAIGIGHGLVGDLQNRFSGTDIEFIPVIVSEQSYALNSEGKPRFLNLRAEIWWEIGRLYSTQQRWDLTELDAQTADELCQPRWWETTNGKIQIESKDEIRRRTGSSPDSADALLLAYFSGRPPMINDAHWQDTRLVGDR